jgi:hypothetical protein
VSKIRVFTCFDLEHDRDLYELLLAQSLGPASGFEIVGCSSARGSSDLRDDALRASLERVDEVIVICGVHTSESMRVSAELGIVQEEECPYFLLWGRRELMCTKPISAKNDDGIYSWTPQILADQLVVTMRRGNWQDGAANMRRPAAVRRPSPAPAAASADAARRT